MEIPVCMYVCGGGCYQSNTFICLYLYVISTRQKPQEKTEPRSFLKSVNPQHKKKKQNGSKSLHQ